ncbi:VOC family protein [Micromonospora sp. NPDC018662]|uniref:VOC family protein n=1 Tax=Micromonospora sp. NPDC018662 TaxID=3364238 RepID=UPI0037BCFB05
MGNPVIHFEIIGKDPERLRDYLGDLFGWQFETGGPVAPSVSEAGRYGFMDATDETGQRIPGGIGGGPGFDSHVVFYVKVPDVEAALRRAESLGGRRVMGPERNAAGLVVGHLTDPEGNLIGLAALP